MRSITNSRLQFDGDRCACSSQWHVVHRLACEGGYTDFLADANYLDVWECRDGGWKLLHRVVTGDLDRWVRTFDIGQALSGTNDPLHGCRESNYHCNLWFEILKHLQNDRQWRICGRGFMG